MEYPLHLAVVDVLIGVDPVRDAREVVPRPHILPREEDAVVRSRPSRERRSHFLPVLTIATRLRSRPAPAFAGGSAGVETPAHGPRRALQIDQHVSAFDPDRIGPQVLGRGRAQRLAGADVETRLVQGTFDLAVLHPAVGEQAVRVRAHALGCVDRLADAVERDGRAIDVRPRSLAIAERVRARHLSPRHSGSPLSAPHARSVLTYPTPAYPQRLSGAAAALPLTAPR